MVEEDIIVLVVVAMVVTAVVTVTTVAVSAFLFFYTLGSVCEIECSLHWARRTTRGCYSSSSARRCLLTARSTSLKWGSSTT